MCQKPFSQPVLYVTYLFPGNWTTNSCVLNPYYGPNSVTNMYYETYCDGQGNINPTIKKGKEGWCLRNMHKLKNNTLKNSKTRQSAIKGNGRCERSVRGRWRRQRNLRALRVGRVGECSRWGRRDSIPAKWAGTAASCGALRRPFWRMWRLFDGKS